MELIDSPRPRIAQKKISLYSPFLILLILIASGAAFVTHSVISINRADSAMESLFRTGILDSRGEKHLLNIPDRTEHIFLRNRTEPEILAAALLLQSRRSVLAEDFLRRLPEKDSSLSRWSREILLEQWRNKQEWERIIDYTEKAVQTGIKDPVLQDYFYEALWEENRDIPEFAESQAEDSPWGIPLLDKKGHLKRQQYIRFLLSENVILIKEMLQTWSPSYGEEKLGLHIIEARTMIEQKQFGDAEVLLKKAWADGLNQDTRLPDPFLSELRDAIRLSGRAKDWIPLIEKWPGLNSSGYSGAFLAASVYESAGSTDQADNYYLAAENASSDIGRRNRAQWYRFRLLIRNNPEMVPDFLALYATQWGETDYFNDLLDEYYTLLVRNRAWKKLEQTVAVLLKTSLKDSLLQGTYLLDKAEQDGRIKNSVILREAKSAKVLQRPSLSYFSLLSNPYSWPKAPSEPERNLEENLLSPEEREIDAVYRILLKAGKFDTSWYLWNSREDALDYETVELFCKGLFERKKYYQSIRFAGYWFYRWPASSAAELLPWLYPIDPELPVAEYSREYGQEEEIILGIIRRESAFHRTIESYAGAVGLMQLMPTTASDLASRYRIRDWDLNDPHDNILFGSIYLNWLKERPWTDNYANILAAYNGGGGNLRRWKRQFGDLEDQLFIQSIPFRETRNYIRKVIVAAGSYRYLNTGAPPGEWMNRFFLPFPAI